MMELIVKSYFSILFAVCASCLSILLLGIYLILRKNVREVRRNFAKIEPAVDEDIHAIAGDDLFSTQLDLARAFIESGKDQFAKKILESIVADGNLEQQEQAKLLLGEL